MKLQVGPTIPLVCNKTQKYLKLYQCSACKDVSLIEHAKADDTLKSEYAYSCCTKCIECGKKFYDGGHYIEFYGIFPSLHKYRPERRQEKRDERLSKGGNGHGAEETA